MMRYSQNMLSVTGKKKIGSVKKRLSKGFNYYTIFIFDNVYSDLAEQKTIIQII